MSRLIDAFALCEYANNLKDKQVDANDIMRFPRVDAEPVRHGHWRDEQIGRWIYAECDLCRTVHDTRSNYCPNCGAKMDEVEDADT